MRTERIDAIEDYILTNKNVTLDTLCEVFQVSKNTVRRDINLLLQRGNIKKVYGGVTANEERNNQMAPLLPFSSRSIQLEREKDAICKRAAAFVEDNDIIYVDTGSTSQNLVDYLAGRQCTVITNSLQVALKAVAYPELTVISLPGRLRRDTLSFVGGEAAEYLAKYNIRKAFMCCTGVTVKDGLTNATHEEYLIKKAVIACSHDRFLLADHTKLGRFALMTYCQLSDIHHLITDSRPPAEYLEYCEAHQIAIHEADLSSPL